MSGTESAHAPDHLTVSVVVYNLQPETLGQALHSVVQGLQPAHDAGQLASVRLWLINNGDPRDQAQTAALQTLLDALPTLPWLVSELLSGHGNLGYGRGHNLVITEPGRWAGADAPLEQVQYYLILNPDVSLATDALQQGLAQLRRNTQQVAVSPRIRDGRGKPASGCKRYPSVLDLLLRGFAPGAIRRLFRRRLDHYSMAGLPDTGVTAPVPIISGCCMLFRGDVLRWLDGFDERYFLYFEDFDLSLRAQRYGDLAYLPTMQITHLGGRSARKGLRHILWFARSALRFFGDHGWKWR